MTFEQWSVLARLYGYAVHSGENITRYYYATTDNNLKWIGQWNSASDYILYNDNGDTRTPIVRESKRTWPI